MLSAKLKDFWPKKPYNKPTVYRDDNQLPLVYIHIRPIIHAYWAYLVVMGYKPTKPCFMLK